MRALAPSLALALAGLTGACLNTEPFDETDAAVDLGVDAPPPPPPEVVAVLARDHDGRAWPLDALPRQPILTVQTTRSVAADEPFLFLFEGTFDHDELLDDLRRAPLLVRHAARALPIAVEGMVITPERLTPGATYTLGVGGWARGDDDRPLAAPHVERLQIARVAAGASVTDSWPADGTAGAPTGLTEIALRFDDQVSGTDIRLLGPEGPVEATLEARACETIGWRGGDCRVLRPTEDLAPSAAHRIEVGPGVVDRSGAPVGPWRASFTTGDDRARLPSFLPIECHLDEVPAGPACVLADDHALEVRATLDAPVRAFLESGSAHDALVANRGEIRLRLAPLEAGIRFDAQLVLLGLGGERHVETLALGTAPELATLTIAEVRSDPRGPEPRQEYVEILNYGAEPVTLEGVAIADRPDREGDVVTSAQTLPAGARALLVANAFDPEDPNDPPVPPGVMLVRVGTSLASAGLSNAGETLYLRDAELRRLSTAPPRSTGAGRCLVRRGSVREGDEAAFVVGECTPGTAPVAE